MFAISFLIFCPWKKGPEWYLKFSPALFYIMMYANYVFLPGLNLGMSIYYTVNPKYDLKILPLESWVVFFTVVCFSRLLEFYTTIKKVVLDDARIYLETRKLKETGRINEIENMRFENGGLSLVGEKKIIMKALNELKNDDCNNYL